MMIEYGYIPFLPKKISLFNDKNLSSEEELERNKHIPIYVYMMTSNNLINFDFVIHLCRELRVRNLRKIEIFTMIWRKK